MYIIAFLQINYNIIGLKHNAAPSIRDILIINTATAGGAADEINNSYG